MINYKKTIKNIREVVPDLDLGTIIKILEAIVEESSIYYIPNNPQYYYPLSDKPWWEQNYRITCK